MTTRCRFTPLAAISLCSVLLGGCVATPDDVATLNAERSLDQRSTHGLVEATVSLDGEAISRGPNDFSITLRALDLPSAPVLTGMEASMAAHGHRASASRIESADGTFHAVGLDLFMSGRWQVALGVELENSSDVVEFALDVP